MTIAAAPSMATAEFSVGAIVVAVVLLVVNGAFTATEIGLLAARPARIERAHQEGDRRAEWALKALGDLQTSFSATQLGVTMSSLGLGVIAEPAVAALLVRWLEPTGLPEGATLVIAVTLALAVVVFLHMVVGDMAPKNLAIARAEDVVLVVARWFGWFVAVFRPLIIVLNVTSTVVLRVLRTDPVEGHQLMHTADELALVVTDSVEQGMIPSEDAGVLGAALRLGSITAQSAMTPRTDLAAVPAEALLDDIVATAVASGHTRLIVYSGDLDNAIGIVHVKDVIVLDEDQTTITAAELLRPLAAIPPSRSLDLLLADMREDGHHAMLVVDEFGSTIGLITMEDVLEELVGDIIDEFDDDDPSLVASDQRWVVPGTMRRDELERLTGLCLEGVSETVSGWTVEHLGRLLKAGDTAVVDGWRLRVLNLEGRRAGRIEIIAPRRGLVSATGSSAHG
ncbi:MAG: hemolysin family protein [Nitriliruptoraceae bacterium]